MSKALWYTTSATLLQLLQINLHVCVSPTPFYFTLPEHSVTQSGELHMKQEITYQKCVTWSTLSLGTHQNSRSGTTYVKLCYIDNNHSVVKSQQYLCIKKLQLVAPRSCDPDTNESWQRHCPLADVTHQINVQYINLQVPIFDNLGQYMNSMQLLSFKRTEVTNLADSQQNE